MTNYNDLLIWTIGIYLICFLFSLFYKYKQPKRINAIYGYRTPRAMKSIENWNFANTTAANYFLIGTHILLLVSILVLYCFQMGLLSFNISLVMITCVIPVVSLLIVILFVEIKLKDFDNSIK